ncbi:hypothetical protein OROMI_033502 [Orobanche minor]
MQNIVANANASAKEYYVQRSWAADNPSRKHKSTCTCSDDDLTALRLGKSEYVPPPSNTESVGDANKIRQIITFRLETMKQAAYVALSNILNQNYKLSVTAEDVKNHLESIEKIRSRNLRGAQGISLNPPSQAGINRSISTVWDEEMSHALSSFLYYKLNEIRGFLNNEFNLGITMEQVQSHLEADERLKWIQKREMQNRWIEPFASQNNLGGPSKRVEYFDFTQGASL